VYAKIAGIPFPFIGVDGTDACTQVFLPDGSKAGCPLKAGQDYVYKNNFKVLEIYPKVRIHLLQLHCRDDTETNKKTLIMCVVLFESHFQAVTISIQQNVLFSHLLGSYTL
jgi:hypothetical protein